MALILVLLQLTAGPDSLGTLGEASPDAVESLLSSLQTAGALGTVEVAAGRNPSAKRQVRLGWGQERLVVRSTLVNHGGVATISGFAQATPHPRLRLLAGDLRAGGGGGLLVGTPRFGSPGGPGAGSPVTSRSLRGYSGTAPDARGVAIHVAGKGWESGMWRASGHMPEGPAGTGHSGGFLDVGFGDHRLGLLVFSPSGLPPRLEGTVSSSLGKVAAAVSVTGSSAVGRIAVGSGRLSPRLTLAFRRLQGLSSYASPLSTRSHSNEAGVTLGARFPTRSGTWELGHDTSTSGADRRSRTRLSVYGRIATIHAERRTMTATSEHAYHALTVYMVVPVNEWRIRAFTAHELGPGLDFMAATREGQVAAYLRLRTRVTWRQARIDLSITEFASPSGGPVVAVYEPSPRFAFPIARLSGYGRRLHLRVSAASTVSASMALEHRRAVVAREQDSVRFEIALTAGRVF